MPQVDVLVSVCTVTDPKFTDDDLPESPRAAEEFVPAESFWLSGDAEFDWFDRNAFLERKESTRGNMMTMTSKNHNQADSNSQRFTTRNLKSNPPAAAAIFGLSNTQKKKKSNHVDKRCGGRKNNNKPPIMRLFPSKRSESIKSTAATTEPSSPKVSCIGRVRSKKGRRRKSAAAAEKSTVERTRSEPDGEKKKKKKGLGFYSGLKSLFRSDRRCRNESAVRISQPAAAVKLSPSSKKHEGDDSECEPLGLGMMTRYVSGRRSESWIDDDVAINDSMESFRRRGPPGG